MSKADRTSLDAANEAFVRAHPGERAERQPVQSFIEGAQHFDERTFARLGESAMDALRVHAPDADALAAAMMFGGRARGVAAEVHRLIGRKLAREPVEDYRIDFEDGYGVHGDADEDAMVDRCARAIVAAARSRRFPPSWGIRVKPLTQELMARSLRTTERFVHQVHDAGGGLPEGFVVTLAKVTVREQIAYFAKHLSAIEQRLGLRSGSLHLEIMVETPAAILGGEGRCPLPDFVQAADGRLVAASLGTYDYTAALGITAAYQRQRHPACEHARLVMQVALAGTGVQVRDGSTALLPVEPTPRVHEGWRLHHGDVAHALKLGIYGGWDLHPAQLVSRYAAVFSFYLAGLDGAAQRLSSFLKTVRMSGAPRDIADDVATGQALLNFFARAIACGATDRVTVSRATGLRLEHFDGRPFRAVLQEISA